MTPARAARQHRHIQHTLEGHPDWRSVPMERRARAILDYYDRNPEKFRERWGEPTGGRRGR